MGNEPWGMLRIGKGIEIHDRCPDRGRDVYRAGVVRDQQLGTRQESGQTGEIELADQGNGRHARGGAGRARCPCP